MGLEQLSYANPLQQLGNLPLGYQGAMYQPLMQQYQQEEGLRSLYNKQATEGMNPALIQNQQLANQQLQALMPTHQLAGQTAQEQMNIGHTYIKKQINYLILCQNQLKE